MRSLIDGVGSEWSSMDPGIVWSNFLIVVRYGLEREMEKHPLVTVVPTKSESTVACENIFWKKLGRKQLLGFSIFQNP